MKRKGMGMCARVPMTVKFNCYVDTLLNVSSDTISLYSGIGWDRQGYGGVKQGSWDRVQEVLSALYPLVENDEVGRKMCTTGRDIEPVSSTKPYGKIHVQIAVKTNFLLVNGNVQDKCSFRTCFPVPKI